METYREFWYKKYGLRQPCAAVGDAAVDTPVGRCTAEGGPENCSNHGPKLRRYDEQDGDIKSTRPSSLPNDAFDGGEVHGLPRWFIELYHTVAKVAKEGEESQKKSMLEFAKDKDFWHDDLTAMCQEKFGDRFAHGIESDVYEIGDAVVKVVTMRMAKTPIAAMERIVLHNRLFPETMLEVVGCGWANRYGKHDDQLAFLVKQRKVEFDKGETTTEDVAKFMEQMGFKPTGRKSTYVSSDGTLLATDMHRENVVMAKDGTMVVLDSLMKINTASEGLGGSYDTENPPKTMWRPKRIEKDKGATSMDEKNKQEQTEDSPDPNEIPGTGMSSDEWHRRRRAEQYAAEGMDPRRLDWKKLHEQSMRLREQRRRSGD